MFDNFSKTYSDRTYKYTTMVRHKGTVIAFAMDDKRRIVYSVLNLAGDAQTSVDTANDKSPFDKDAWAKSPTELVFPTELAEVGFGVADQTLMPVVKGTTPAPVGTMLPAPSSDDAKQFNYFLSTTARLSADAPFQVLSDGQFLYLFRQAIAADHADMVSQRDKDGKILLVAKRDAAGNVIKDANNKEVMTQVPLVNSTLLVDRFVLVGTQLAPRMEVRYQRSRSKTRPASRKDSLGPKDLDGNVFFEPTQELRFIGDLSGGRFTALLLPTAVAETQRWQIFVCKERKDAAGNVTDSWMDSFNIERAADGLFNTLGKQIYTCVDHPDLFAGKPGKCALPGKLDERLTCEKTLIPRLVTSGYAESALKFAQATHVVELINAVTLGTNFTLEAWIKPEVVTTTTPQVLCSGIAPTPATTGFSLSIETNSRLRVSFDDAKKATSENILTPGKWIHVAITFDGTTCKFYANGKPAGESQELKEKATATTFLNAFGAKANAYQGTIDEIRVWRRVRSGRELRADLHQRLMGLEPGLTGYWRFDEGAGTKAFDQSATLAHGTITGAAWTPSDAPVGEHPGIERSSLRLSGRNVASGPTALLYFQQTKARTGYDQSQEKQLKQNGRVMLAVATSASGENKNLIAALDFGVTATGRLAQIPDNLTLQTVQAKASDTKSLQEQLATLPEAEKNLLALRTAFAELRDARITVFSKADPLKVGVRKKFGIGQVPTGIVIATDINPNNMEVDPPLKAIHNEASDTWAIEISDAHLARLRAAEPGETPASLALPDIQQRINTKQKAINDTKALVKNGFNVTMPLVQTDALGLTITGGVLGFAWTNDAPLLFDSATGSLALYFRGSDDQFFVTYYTTLTTRATYPLKADDNTNTNAVSCLARSSEAELEKLEIEIADGDNADLCKVTITVPDIAATLTETWQMVPRDAQNFAKALNGLAGERAFLGSGRVESNGNLTMTQGIRRGLAQGTTLMVGETRVQVREKVNPGATSIALDNPSTTTETLPVFFLAYDYLANAAITDAQGAAVPSDLYNGSRLIVAVPSDKSEHRVMNQTATSGTTITCQWTAAAPGTTLVFDGKTECGQADAAKLDGFNATGDLTIEAWVRPGPIQKGAKARVLQHRTTESQYALGLEGQELQTAMDFNGSNDGVSVPAVQGLPGGNTVHTIEAWVRPTALPANRAWLMLLGGAGPGAHHWLLNKEGKTQFGVFAGAQIAPNLPLNQWTHLASTFDGTMLRVYVNGALAGEIAATFNLTNVPSLPLTLAQAQLGEDFFAGQMDEVRVWKRARTQAEIVADMNRRLGGKETDLVGYWHFDGRAANDFARHQTHGKIVGAPTQAVSPLTAYNVFAGVGGQAVQGVDFLPTGNWTHLAATFKQTYGLSFDGVSNSLDAGTDLTLDINRDLTIEVFLHLNANGKRQTLLTRGKFHNQESDPGKRASQHPPYALLLDEDNKLIFAFEDAEQNLHEFKTTAALTTGFHRLAVTRERQSMSQDDASDPSGKKIVAWDAIRFYVDKTLVAADKKRYEDLAKNQPLDVGNSNEALTIASSTTIFRNGTATAFGHLTGTISEIRLWNGARDAKEFKLPNPKPAGFDEREARTDNKDTQFIGKDITGGEKGLVAWWRFSEGNGKRAFDSKGQNHATINGASWVKGPNPEGSALKLYINGQFQQSRQVTLPVVTTNQFTLGALQSDTTLREFFQGEIEEVRVWQRTRTQEQIQDNLFRRLLGEREDLLAYYTFTPDAATPTRLADDSPRGNHLTIQGTALVLSTAPIGDDTPQVRSALAGVRTTFNDFLHSTPALQEYGDVQFDSQSNMIGVYKRCYGFIKNGEWQLITGFKVGDLVTEWIGQVQFAPQLIGYIEGAPPVPSENLTQKSDKAIGDLDDYNEASTIEIVEADETTYTYAASKAGGFDMSLEAAVKFGAKSSSEAGLGLITEIEETKALIGPKTTLEFSAGWKEDANTSVGQTTAQATSMELRGRFTTADETAREERRRFVPDNVGLALVKSETADVFALRLKHNNALIAYQMRPNPDIPKDWNIIHFPINPRYTKQGTLDGKIGMTPDASRTLTDVDYPNALNYSPDSSYFKPIEAYALKNRIQQTETALKAYYEQYAAHLIGQRLPPFNPGASGDLGSLAPGDLLKGLPQLHKRNIVNTYVWTADGGLFAETQETMDSRSESFGGEWSFQQMIGLDLKVGVIIAKVGMTLELTALVGGHLNLEVTKTQDSKSSFGLNVNLDKVERDIYLRNENEEIIVDTSDPLRPKPKKQPGKVDAYRFLSFYLESQSEHHDQFYARVVDPIWLEQSDDPGAVALRAARQSEKKPPCWRVLHRVTYVSRVLPPLADNAAASPLEKTLQTLDIESNYELIKQLEPFVADKLTTPATFTDAVRDTLTSNLPELLPHTAEIEQYLRQYFGVPELASSTTTPDDPLGQASLDERAPNQPPLVGAGIDQTLKLGGASVDTTLEGSVSDDRINQAEALFVTWEKIIGDGPVTFADRHSLKTKATFPKRGVYALRLTASDGQLSANDTMTVTVNEPPTVSILAPTQPERKLDSIGNPFWEVELKTEITTGLGDPAAQLAGVEWSIEGGKNENVEFANRVAANTKVTFKKSGSYLLKLTVDNGSFIRNAQVVIEVAARVKDQLQVLYTFEEREGESVLDVSGNATRLNLTINEPANARRVGGGVALRQATSLTTREPLTELTKALQASNEITIEAWLKPKTANVTGMRRIITCSNGPAARNFTLGQSGRNYYVGLRTTTNNNGTNDTDSNASRKALIAGTVTTTAVAHVVCTRDNTGLTVLYLNGEEVGHRTVSGDFSAWDSSFPLALGNETAADDGHDRAWQGEFHLVALYSRALSAAEVVQNFEFGKVSDGDAPLPPIVSAGADRIVRKQDAAVAVQLEGRVTTDRHVNNLTTTWSQVSGPESANDDIFVSKTNPQTVANFTQIGRYVLRLTVDDGEFLAVDEVVIVIQPQPISAHLPLTESSLTTELKLLVKDVPGLETDGVRYRWQQISGPASMMLTQAEQLNGTARFTERGEYVLLLRAERAGRLWNSIPVILTVHQRPVLDVGTDRLITVPTNKIMLSHSATVKDSGLGNLQDTPAVQWEVVPKTPTVTLQAGADTTTVSFEQSGVYKLRCTATNPHIESLTTSAEIAVTFNRPPEVRIATAADQPILLRNAMEELKLEAIVSDDGLPNPEVSLQWSRANGLGGVVFTDPAAAYTTAIFSAAGEYELQLTASDGASSISDSVTFVVHAPPTILLSPLLSVKRKDGAFLSANITDKGLANGAEGQVTTLWEKLSGPGGETIVTPNANATSVTFSGTGTYVFEVVADNGLLQRSATVQVNVRN